MKKILFITLILLCSIKHVSASCNYSTISRMKSIVSNINISYDYQIIDNNAYFDITLNNVTNDIYFIDSFNNKSYYYSDTNNGEITIRNYTKSGSYKFYSNLDECYGDTLGTKYYNLPSYNKYYNSEYCEDIQNINICQKWVDIKYSEEEFEKLINDYKSGQGKEENKNKDISKNNEILDKISNLYINYYYYFLGTIIIICIIIIIIKRRNTRFKL